MASFLVLMHTWETTDPANHMAPKAVVAKPKESNVKIVHAKSETELAGKLNKPAHPGGRRPLIVQIIPLKGIFPGDDQEDLSREGRQARGEL